MRYLNLFLCVVCIAFSISGKAQKLHVGADTGFSLHPVKLGERTITQQRMHVRYGLLDEKGNWVLKPEYREIYEFKHCFVLRQDKLLNPKSKDLYIFTDRSGKKKAEYNHFKASGNNFIVCEGGRRSLRYKAWEGGKKGLLDAHGNLLQAAVYDQILEHKNGGYIIIKGGTEEQHSEARIAGKYGFLGATGELIHQPVYDYVSGAAPHEQGLTLPVHSQIRINKGGKWVKTSTGWKVIGGKWGMLDRNYKMLVEPVYELATRMANGYLLVNSGGTQKLSSKELGLPWETYVEGGLWGILDSNGVVKVPVQYTYLRTRDRRMEQGRLGNVLVASKEPRKHYYFERHQGINLGLISYEGKELTPFIYSELDLSYWYQGKIRASKGGTLENDYMDLNHASWGFLDSNGRELSRFEYSDLFSQPGFPYIQYSLKNPDGSISWGLMDQSCRQVTGPDYKELHGDRRSAVYRAADLKNKWGLLTLRGEPLTDMKYSSLQAIDTMYYIVKTNGCNILRRDGKELFEEWTDPSTCFNAEGYLLKQLNGKWGAINHLGDTVMPFIYEDSRAIAHRGKLLMVSAKGKWGVYDLEKKAMVLPAEYDELAAQLVQDKKLPYQYVLLTFSKNGKRGRLKEDMGRSAGVPGYFSED